MIKAYLAPFQ